MKPGDRSRAPTVSEVVRRASALCDPDGADTATRALYDGFEDDDRPATSVEDLGAELEQTIAAVDAEGPSPASRMAVAAAVWLATNPEQGEDREHVLREAARLRFQGEPPPEVADWLAEQRIAV